MKKLNNKGMTTIEVILCFVLVVIVTMSMYETISTFNEKRIEEESKSKIYSYKNNITKEIQDDLIKKGVISASVATSTSTEQNVWTATINLKDGSTKTLRVTQQLVIAEGSNDNSKIEYGSGSDIITYVIPDVGEYKDKTTGKRIKNLTIGPNIVVEAASGVLTIDIPFSHPDLQDNRYSIRIVCPIDYVTQGSTDTVGDFKLT